MGNLAEKIRSGVSVPYVYSYPPTRSYKPSSNFSLENPVFTKDVNIYIHIPFCDQKCTFCGYLTLVDSRQDFRDRYIDCLMLELEMYRNVLRGKKVRSVNLGGGTPSLLTPDQFRRIMAGLRDVIPDLHETATEISIEATPESVMTEKILVWLAEGINRVSIGVQSFEDREIALSRRHNTKTLSVQAMDRLKELTVPNVCVDIMYGLSGQSASSWQTSVTTLIGLRPETVELYSLALIPGSPLSTIGQPKMNQAEKSECYRFARSAFLDAGYLQDCHLRFVLPGKGAYEQQANVFRGQSLLGLGVGARSYADNMHYRNFFNSTNGRGATLKYMDLIELGVPAVESSISINGEDKIARYVVYNIEHLHKAKFFRNFGMKFEEKYSKIYLELLSLGLISDNVVEINLTPEGLVWRDLIAHEFFSSDAERSEQAYWSTSGKRS